MRSRSEATTRLNLPVKKIINEYQNGISTPEIAKKYNCNGITIGRLLKKSNIDVTRKIDLPIEQIIIDYQNNIIPSDIAKKYNCSNVTIFNRLIEYNIYIRTVKEIMNASIYKICIKCDHIFLGNQTSLYCPDCSPNKYCYKFDEDCREHNREKYERECFFCGKTEEENKTKLCVHHVDYNKNQGCDETPDWKLIPLCSSCHGITNGNKERREIWKARILYLHKEYWSKINE